MVVGCFVDCDFLVDVYYDFLVGWCDDGIEVVF